MGSSRSECVYHALDGLKMQYVQGAGSFSTFDEFLRISYGTEHWRASTRVVYSSSANDYSYINHDKKLNIDPAPCTYCIFRPSGSTGAVASRTRPPRPPLLSDSDELPCSMLARSMK